MTGEPNRPHEVTAILGRIQAGDRAATDDLFPLVYQELRSIAERFMRSDRAGHTLQPTAVVNEAYLRMVGPSDLGWESRAHFFGAAAQAIRRILTDHARTKGRIKRGGGARPASLDEHDVAGAWTDAAGEVDFVALDGALERLSRLDAEKARVVELRFFAGLTGEQTALAMGVSPSTVARHWDFARAWLRREISGESAPERGA
ncbi:MAG: sigma-70 family RNA polymerase sigma factor [Phycisphaerales bacterium]